ncbi:Hypothetical protein POVR2_LOCUS49 [uncultured virus]|nr:Hypothetical protein POVR2_LOCUS49 [uncultured virus]
MTESVPDEIIAEICYHLDDNSLFELAKSQGLYSVVNSLLKSNYFHYRRVANLLVSTAASKLQYDPDVNWQQVYYATRYNLDGISIWSHFYQAGMNHLPTLKVLEYIDSPAVPVPPTSTDLEAVGNVEVMKYLVEQKYVDPTARTVGLFMLDAIQEMQLDKEDILVYLVSVNIDKLPDSILTYAAKFGFYKLVKQVLPLRKYGLRAVRNAYKYLVASRNAEMLDLLLSYYPGLLA